MQDQPEFEPEKDQPASADPLSMLQRVVAGVAGAAALGAGGASVFMTSNQAGSVALVGVGALLLIVAVNGSPLLGAKFKDYELTMAPRRRKVVEQAKHEDPEEGQRKLDVLEQLDPASREDPAVINAHALLYQKEVEAAIVRTLAKIPGASMVRTDGFEPGRTNLQVRASERTVDVELLYSTNHRFMSIEAFEFSLTEGRISRIPRILVTNMRAPAALIELLDSEMAPRANPVQIVRWQDYQDDKALACALHLFGIMNNAAVE